MMDDGILMEEKLEKVNHFTQQMINSGYSWQQTREVIVSGLKGIIKEEMRRKEEELKRYRTGNESLQSRKRKS